MPPLPRVAPVLNKRGGSSGDLHGNTKTNPKTWGALSAKSAGMTAALFYGFTSVASVRSSSIGILRRFLLSLRRSPLSVFGFNGETLLSGSLIKDTCTQRFVQLAGCHRLC